MKAILLIALLTLPGAFAADRECMVMEPRKSLVIHCLDKDAAGKDALILGLKCNRRGRDDCLAVFSTGRLGPGLELTRGNEKLVVARPKAGSQLRLFNAKLLEAKKFKVREKDAVVVTEKGEPLQDTEIASVVW